MLYNILSIVSGALIFVNITLAAIGKLRSRISIIIEAICGILFITIGIVGLLVPDKYELALTILLLCCAVVYIGQTILLFKKRKNKDVAKVESKKE